MQHIIPELDGGTDRHDILEWGDQRPLESNLLCLNTRSQDIDCSPYILWGCQRSSSSGMGLLLVCGKFSSGVVPYVSLSFVRMEGKPNLGKYTFSFAGRVEDDWLWYMYVAVGWGCRALTSWWSLQTLITCGSFKTWQAQPPRNRVFVSTVNM